MLQVKRITILVLLFIALVALIAFILLRTVSDSFVDAGRCGVGLPSCKDLRCINGYCKSDHPPAFPGLSDLPLAN
jgi:hypothetical protein